MPGGGAGAVMVTEAWADLVVSATLVAVTVKFPAVFPATYNPVEEIVPPVALQVTAVLEVPVTVAENCWDAPSRRGADVGDIPTFTVGVGGEAGAEMVTEATAVLLWSAALVAVTVKFPALFPARNKPVEEIVPPVAV